MQFNIHGGQSSIDSHNTVHIEQHVLHSHATSEQFPVRYSLESVIYRMHEDFYQISTTRQFQTET